MSKLTIDIPEDAHNLLKKYAEEDDRSLTKYITRGLIYLSQHPYHTSIVTANTPTPGMGQSPIISTPQNQNNNDITLSQLKELGVKSLDMKKDKELTPQEEELANINLENKKRILLQKQVKSLRERATLILGYPPEDVHINISDLLENGRVDFITGERVPATEEYIMQLINEQKHEDEEAVRRSTLEYDWQYPDYKIDDFKTEIAHLEEDRPNLTSKKLYNELKNIFISARYYRAFIELVENPYQNEVEKALVNIDISTEVKKLLALPSEDELSDYDYIYIADILDGDCTEAEADFNYLFRKILNECDMNKISNALKINIFILTSDHSYYKYAQPYAQDSYRFAYTMPKEYQIKYINEIKDYYDHYLELNK